MPERYLDYRKSGRDAKPGPPGLGQFSAVKIKMGLRNFSQHLRAMESWRGLAIQFVKHSKTEG
jgi:hypothetical protein